MKTYAPKGLRGSDLRALMDEMQATPAQVAKFLRVGERTVWRWLSDNSAPFAALAALWHETPTGRHTTALDVGNELAIVRGLAQSFEGLCNTTTAQLARVLAISDTGAANDPLMTGPPSLGAVPARGVEGLQQIGHDAHGHAPAPPIGPGNVPRESLR